MNRRNRTPSRDNSNNNDLPPPAPPDDLFMSDSPRPLPPPQSSISTSTSHHHFYMDGGLHHRSIGSRATTSSSAAAAAELSFNDHHRNSASVSHNNNINTAMSARPSRLFQLHNPYHTNTRQSNSTNNNSSGTNNSNGGKKITISISKALQCLFTLLFIGYIGLLVYTHALWSQESGTRGNGNGEVGYSSGGKNEWNNAHSSGRTENNGQQQPLAKRGVRSSSSFGDKEVHSRQGIDNTANENEVDATTTDTTDLDQATIMEDYRIGSLNDLLFRTQHRRKRRVVGNQQQQQLPPPVGLRFIFDSSRQNLQQHFSEKQVASNTVSKNDSGNQEHLEMAKRKQYERRQNRKKRTTPPLQPLLTPSTQQQQQQESSDNNASPILSWYNLDHSTYQTVLNNQNRWQDSKEVGSSSSSSSSPMLDTTMNLCGTYAQQAAFQHPQNYFPPHSSSTSTSTPQQQHVPLNSQSKVLITGILSPLGFHLTLALHRQCNITNFIGIDSQMPNDPLSRLEMQDRLEVLLDELSTTSSVGGGKKSTLWYVPFLGLESKHSRNEPAWRVEERKKREELLVKIRNFPHQYIGMDGEESGGGGGGASSSATVFNTQPYERYGVPLSPGVNADGYGTLDLIAEYRPTHIVHLARTQSDSLLNSKRQHHDRQQQQTNIKKKEGGESSIRSRRPHLYDLRMGMAGMEQLLSSAIAQTIIPPPPSLLESSSAAMSPTTSAPPHVVYASSYDARYYSETSKRLRNSQQRQQQKHHRRHHHHENKEIILGEEEEQITNHRKHHSPPRGFHGVSHLIDEILASAYHGLHGIQSIGLRFDAVYGPRGFGAPSSSVPLLNVNNRMRKNVGVSPDVALAEAEVRRMYRKWIKMSDDTQHHVEEEGDEESSLIEESGWLHASHHLRDYVFVEDAVGAIMAAMQYRAVQGSPTTFNIGSGEMNTLSSFADKIQQVAFDDKRPTRGAPKSVIDVERSNAARSAGYTANEYLGWSAKTTLKEGVAKLLAWHLDRALPFFSSTLSNDEVDYSESKGVAKPMNGKDLLSKNNVESCSTDKKGDATCLLEKHTSYPCASECSTKSCTSSIFDNVIPVVHTATEGCYMVLYTAPLGYDVEALEVETEYSDSGSKFEFHDGNVCTVAFVPSESTLVKSVIEDLPANAQSMLDALPSDSYSTKVKKLNGHLAHRGWLLIFVDGATHPLPPEELLIPKLAPARLFHPSVRRAMYVDESFSHTPYPEDALFLETETYRGVTKSRTIKGLDAKGKKRKYKLPEEPERYAVMLASQMRDVSTEGRRVSLRDATRAMLNEKGYETNTREPKEIKAQREFYERARAHINSMDLRSSTDPALRHQFEMKDFIRSQWVLYNLKVEEGHDVRCEWYKEHSRWTGSNSLDSGMDHLSFAYAMAKRELIHKIVNDEPLPTESTLEEKVIKASTDAHEWHPIFVGDGSKISLGDSSKDKDPSAVKAVAPVNNADHPEVDENKDESETSDVDTEPSYYVRIMSDEVMVKARKDWAKFVKQFEKD